jgi:hypothetical protein
MFKSMQEAYDKAVDHLEKQGRQAVDIGSRGNSGYEGGCVYLASNGDKCVVGAFIPDGHPGQKFIGSVVGLLNQFPDLRDIFKIKGEKSYIEFCEFWCGLQNIHDDLLNLEGINRRLRSFALNRGLTPRKLTKWEAFP